ncbi:MAG: hypothetical protein N2652_10780 [Kiritimatiellae bacterium]|nr:hypothetical protein [Kiritimatiellia bacterium]
MVSGPRMALSGALITAVAAAQPFEIHVRDAVTGRGVPLVELRTVHQVRYWTDNAGRVAFDEPGWMSGRVFFFIRSPGYVAPRDGFGMEGQALDVRPGGRAEVRLVRTNIAERIGRITGAGRYRDSQLLGHTVPVSEPPVRGGVVGQDSVQAVVHRGQIHWFWGDTSRASHPLGNFHTTGAVSALPAPGSPPQDLGAMLRYWESEEGFVRPMAPDFGEGMVWVDGACSVPDASGRQRLVVRYARMKSLERQLGHGLAEWDEERCSLRRLFEYGESVGWRHPAGQAVRVGDWVLFAQPFATVRVPARFEAVTNPAAYECFAIRNGAWGWGATGEPGTPEREREAIQHGALTAGAARLQLRDAGGRLIRPHAGSVRWNGYRRRWVMIFVESGGTESFLGEVWYSEAPDSTGPWCRAVKVATHPSYSFYNPVHHDFLDEAAGRYIYFEGTFAETFSGAPFAIPRYDYNQLLYRLDLDDPRLRAVFDATREADTP